MAYTVHNYVSNTRLYASQLNEMDAGIKHAFDTVDELQTTVNGMQNDHDNIGTIQNNISTMQSSMNSLQSSVTALQSSKQNAPSTAGTQGQVLSLDSQGNPVWTTPASGVTQQQFTELSSTVSGLQSTIATKQNAPSAAGTAGQVLGLDSNLAPVWINQTVAADTSTLESTVSNNTSKITALENSLSALSVQISFTDDNNGNVTLTASLQDSSTPSTVPVTGVSFASNSGTYNVGDTFTLTPIITPANATDQTGSWFFDASVVSMSNGVFTALSAGTSTIRFITNSSLCVAEYALTVTAAASPSNNLLNPASEALGWTRSVGEGKYLKVNDDGVGGLGTGNNYQYCGCYDITNAHLSGKTIVCNAMIRTLALTAGAISSSYRKDASQTIGIVSSSSSSINKGVGVQLPEFDESVYTHICITTAYAKDILNLFDGTEPLYISTKTPFSASDVDEYHA